MKTLHKINFSSSVEMDSIPEQSVDLVVTSPPYPMISMWDEAFSNKNSRVRKAFDCGDGFLAFELMNQELDKVWTEVYRVLKNGGFLCVNVGDALRKIGDKFCLYPNHSRILGFCLNLGFVPLPEILWRKQTNAPNKFMGSGMLPAGAYVTLEHEYILIFRKGSKRIFSKTNDKSRRLESAFFWEERNLWFSDIWHNLKGIKQNTIDEKIRVRSGAFPFELAYRLINMFSLKGDTVLDPFLGTGTTIYAAITAGRNSLGYEEEVNFKEHVFSQLTNIIDFSNLIIENRLRNHLDFVKRSLKNDVVLKYINKQYNFPVVTRQETELVFSEPKTLLLKDDEIEVEYKSKPALYFTGQAIEEGTA